MAKRRKRRTSIRTAAGTVQERYLERMRALRDDPTRVLPTMVGPEPKVIAKLSKRLHRLAAGKTGFADKRDKGVFGAVANALPLADLQQVPRIADMKIAGQRRFFLQRGQVTRACSLGVQNHDEPLVLLSAYRDMAKQESIHFFAGPGFWCTGPTPQPPDEWVESLGEGAELAHESHDRFGCGHEGVRVVLQFRDGPAVAVCDSCAGLTGNLHARLQDRYAGPRVRQPVEVWVTLPDGSRWDPPDPDVAAYRGGVKDERDLASAARAHWRAASHSDGPRYILGEQDFGADQEAFLDALAPTPWERVALTAMTKEGHAGRRRNIEAVLKQNKARLADGVSAMMGTDPKSAGSFVTGLGAMGLRDRLRSAHEEAEKAALVASLPDLNGLGPVGRWTDRFVHTLRQGDRRGAMDQVANALQRGTPPRFHIQAFLAAAGGDLALDARFSASDRAAAKDWVDPARAVLDAEGDAYRETLAAFLADSGSGERLD